MCSSARVGYGLLAVTMSVYNVTAAYKAMQWQAASCIRRARLSGILLDQDDREEDRTFCGDYSSIPQGGTHIQSLKS